MQREVGLYQWRGLLDLVEWQLTAGLDKPSLF